MNTRPAFGHPQNQLGYRPATQPVMVAVTETVAIMDLPKRSKPCAKKPKSKARDHEAERELVVYDYDTPWWRSPFVAVVAICVAARVINKFDERRHPR